MRVAVTSTVIFDVPEDDLETVRRRFRDANRLAVGIPNENLAGQVYVMVALERIEIERRDFE
jgi:hypothetical protein